MKSICFYFQIHQPFRLRRYRFFDIGNDSYYYDDYNNEEIFRRIARNCYLPANQIILQMIKETKGEFKVAYSISGIALEQMELYEPDVIESFKKLAETGSVEFLAETYAHSLSSLSDESEEFENQVKRHTERIESLFNLRPRVFRNTELIYSDEIGMRVDRLGFKGILTEGARHVLGWKSPNYVYCSNVIPRLNILLKNFKLSDDIAFRFSDWGWDQYPLTADKFIKWIAETPDSEKVINLFMNYETFGELQQASTGIFEFLKALPHFAREKGIKFSTPFEVINQNKPVDTLQVIHPISWADEERDVSAWKGNDLQQEAFDKLYGIGEKVRLAKDRKIKQDWNYLQTSDHFYYMSTKHFSDGVHRYFSPYDSPYEAFMNYMNVLSDFIIRVNAQFPKDVEKEELNSLMQTITTQEKTIEALKKENKELEAMCGTRKIEKKPVTSKSKEKSKSL